MINLVEHQVLLTRTSLDFGFSRTQIVMLQSITIVARVPTFGAREVVVPVFATMKFKLAFFPLKLTLIVQLLVVL